MRFIFNFLSGVTSLYLLLIFIRIILTWFSGLSYSKPVAVLSAVTDPYLNWFRRLPGLVLGGFLDVSPIVAMALLSVLNTVFRSLAQYGFITVGFVLALFVGALWSAVSFLLGFVTIVLIVRLFAFFTQREMNSHFWRVIDSISQSVILRVNSFFYSGKAVAFQTALITALTVFVALWLGGSILIGIVSGMLKHLPF